MTHVRLGSFSSYTHTIVSIHNYSRASGRHHGEFPSYPLLHICAPVPHMPLLTLLLLPHEHATFITGLGRASLKLPSVIALLLQIHQRCRTKTLSLPTYPVVHRTLVHHLAQPKTGDRHTHSQRHTDDQRCKSSLSNLKRPKSFPPTNQPTNQPTTPSLGSVDKHALTCLRYPL